MMHYGFCRKHADQMGEGGCPECAMDHQQNEILALRAKLQAAEAETTRIRIAHETEVIHSNCLRKRAEAAEAAHRDAMGERDAYMKSYAEACTTRNSLQAEVARLTAAIEGERRMKGVYRNRVEELEAKPDYPADIDLIKRTATESALRWAWELPWPTDGLTEEKFLSMGIRALIENNNQPKET